MPSCGPSPSAPAKHTRLLVLGLDGVDPRILRPLMESGRMPNFARIAEGGTFMPLATAMPPQSPVAWSNFISGNYPGKHQIYDFIHRNPDTATPTPFSSVAKVEPASANRVLPAGLDLGDWHIPLSGGRTVNLRQGPAFWETLVKAGVDTSIYRAPANYPPPDVSGPGEFRCISGMGTPDLLGGYGEFTLFTPDAPPGGKMVSGGRFEPLTVIDDRAVAVLEGPPNYLRKPDDKNHVPNLRVEIAVARDPEADVAQFTVGGEIVVLGVGEWSEWLPIDFKTGIPASGLLSIMQLPTEMPATIRILLKEVHPKLVFYVTPLNIDPLRPVNPISTPPGFATEIAEACGLYHTVGIPEDAQGLRKGALTEDELLAQARTVLEERNRIYRYALSRFRRGCLFYYWGHTDQLAHLFWRDRDPQHPGRLPEQGDRYASVVEDTYIEMDSLVGEALAALDDDDVIIVMSDHGFTSFRRGFHLNTWLIQQGYMTLYGDPEKAYNRVFSNVDWSRTQAYGLGLNCLYVNLKGRERGGIVEAGADRLQLLRELKDKLLAVRDDDGTPVISKVMIVEEEYPGANPHVAPDILVGYADNYRSSWATALGDMPLGTLEDNLDRWSGDHCIDDRVVPGIILTNRRVVVSDPALVDLAPTMLSVYGIAPPEGMIGRAILALP